jgi:hypothetical protein
MVAATSPIIPILFPYFGVGAEELAVRFRIGLDGDRFRWKSGTKPCLYGLHRLSEAPFVRYDPWGTIDSETFTP